MIGRLYKKQYINSLDKIVVEDNKIVFHVTNAFPSREEVIDVTGIDADELPFLLNKCFKLYISNSIIDFIFRKKRHCYVDSVGSDWSCWMVM